MPLPLIYILIIGSVCADPPALEVGIKDVQNFFNIELLQKLTELHRGNVIVGTSSIKTALMIIAEAAAGQTYQELESALRLLSDTNKQRILAVYNISPIKDATGSIQLQNAIKLWLAKDVRILKSYSDMLHYFYKGEVESVDFGNVAEAVKIINEWVQEKTHGHITSIIDAGSLASDTTMLLTTAVYFKGAWLQAFDKTVTSLRCFIVPNAGCKKIPLMENVAFYNNGYVPNIDCQVVQIPYVNNKASMLILLPMRSGESALENVLRNLAFTPVPTILADLYESELVLQIPRFSIVNKVDLRTVLEQLGIRDVFQNKANLTNAFPALSVKIGAVMHNARIDVNEEGTVASAVTGVSVIPLMATSATVFRVDRPFIFLILDNQTNNILFAGRFVEPDA